jgi:hypothetical protein
VADPIQVSVSVQDLAGALTPENAAGVDVGVLNSKQVWYEFLTQADDRVRPSHRALHGTTWRAGDPNAPVPPLDYGCRCYVRYVAAPGTPAANILPPAEGKPDTQGAAYATFLDADPTLLALGIDWRQVQAAGMAVPIQDRERTIVASLELAGMPRAKAREYARIMRMQEAAPESVAVVTTPGQQAAKLAAQTVVDVDHADYLVPSLAGLVAIGAAAAIGAKVYHKVTGQQAAAMADAAAKWDTLSAESQAVLEAAATKVKDTAGAGQRLMRAAGADASQALANMVIRAVALADQVEQQAAAAIKARAAGDAAKASGDDLDALKAAAIDLTTATGKARALGDQAVALGKAMAKGDVK